MINGIEQVDGEVYVLGFWRDKDLIITENFVAKYEDGEIREPFNITKNEYEYYSGLLLSKRRGETVKIHTLKTIWGFYKSSARLKKTEAEM